MAQFARPISDLDNTGLWAPTPLWSRIDSPDGFVVTSDTTPTVDEPFTVDLSNLLDVGASSDHILRIRWAKASGGGGGKTIRIELREGYVSEGSQGTLIATDDYTINSTTLQTDETTLSAGEADSITDYEDLQIRVMGVTGNRALKVDYVELEAPGTVVNIGTLAETNALIPIEGPPTYLTYKPISDHATGLWITTPLWSKVDDEPTDSASESDKITATASFGSAQFTLPTVATPHSYIGWRIRVRARSTGTLDLSANMFVVSSGNPVMTGGQITNLSSAFAWFDVGLIMSNSSSPASSPDDVVNDIDLTDLGIALSVSALGTGTVEVAAVELRVPASKAALGTPVFEDLSLSVSGRAGPWISDGKTWMVGIESSTKLAWAFSAVNPTDGHNPSEWTMEFCVAELAFNGSWGGGSANAEIVAADRREIIAIDSELTNDGELMVSAFVVNNMGPTHAMIMTVDLGTLAPAHGVGATATVHNTFPFMRSNESTSVANSFKVMDDGGISTLSVKPLIEDNNSRQGKAITGSPNTPFDMVSADGRQHMFYAKGSANDQTVGVRQRTMRSDHTLETAPSSDDTSEDYARLGYGGAYDNGSTWRVVSAHPEADGGGIKALVLNSADTPTVTEEQVSTRDAYDVAYEQSVMAFGHSNRMVVVWIDDAADAIWAASRVDGATTWNDEGQQISGLAGRTRFSAVSIDSDNVGVLVAATTGDIFYYDFALSFGQFIAVGTLAETESLIAITSGVTIVQDVATLAETDAPISIVPAKIASIGVLAETDSPVGIQPIKVAPVGTLAEVDSLLPIPVLAATIDIATLAEIDSLIGISGIKIADIGTLAELESLIEVSATKVAAIGTLLETNQLVTLIITIDAAAGIILRVNIAGDFDSIGPEPARGLGLVRSGDHQTKIFRPNRIIIKK